MTRDQFIQALGRLQGLYVVKAYRDEWPAECRLEMWVDVKEETRTQLVSVQLTDDSTHVTAYSVIGACPAKSEMLISLLKENTDGIQGCILPELRAFRAG